MSMARTHIIRTGPPPLFQNTGIAQIFGLLFGRRPSSVIAMLAALGVASSSASVQQARGNAAAPTGGHSCPHDAGVTAVIGEGDVRCESAAHVRNKYRCCRQIWIFKRNLRGDRRIRDIRHSPNFSLESLKFTRGQFSL
jgi:hypothetical protein